MPIQICPLCKNVKQTQFLYGVDCCNTCSMKHRSHCKKSEPKMDPRTFIGDQDCHFCIFKRNISNQQNLNQSISCIPAKKNSLVNLLQEISILDNRREKLYRTKLFKLNYKADEAISKPIEFVVKPKNTILNFEEWSAMNQLTAIDFFKNLNFVQHLKDDDRKIFIRRMRFRLGIFSTAFRSFQNKQSYLTLIDDVDIFPDITGHFHAPALLEQIRRELIGKVIELKITKEEFLLLLMLHLVVYEVEGISAGGATILNDQRNIYSAALLEHCMLQNSRTGSSRFQDLMSTCVITNKTYHSIGYFAVLFRMKEPNREGNDLIRFE
ncbi:unnamed protein product [Caenorhabditis brenneri]